MPHKVLVHIKVLLFWGRGQGQGVRKPRNFVKGNHTFVTVAAVQTDDSCYNHRQHQQNRRCNVVEEGINEQRLKSKVRSVKE